MGPGGTEQHAQNECTEWGPVARCWFVCVANRHIIRCWQGVLQRLMLSENSRSAQGALAGVPRAAAAAAAAAPAEEAARCEVRATRWPRIGILGRGVLCTAPPPAPAAAAAALMGTAAGSPLLSRPEPLLRLGSGAAPGCSCCSNCGCGCSC
jgi:hypothetical protein